MPLKFLVVPLKFSVRGHSVPSEKNKSGALMILWVSVEAVTLFYCQIYRTDKHSNPTVLNRFVQLLFVQLLPRTRTEEINTIKTNMLSPTGPPISGHDTCRCRG